MSSNYQINPEQYFTLDIHRFLVGVVPRVPLGGVAEGVVRAGYLDDCSCHSLLSAHQATVSILLNICSLPFVAAAWFSHSDSLLSPLAAQHRHT